MKGSWPVQALTSLSMAKPYATHLLSFEFPRRDAWVYSKVSILFWKACRPAWKVPSVHFQNSQTQNLKNPLKKHTLRGEWFFQLLLILPWMVLVKDFSQAYILISLMQVRNSFIVWTRLSVTEIADRRKAELSLAKNIWNQGTVFRENCWVAVGLKIQGPGCKCQEKF